MFDRVANRASPRRLLIAAVVVVLVGVVVGDFGRPFAVGPASASAPPVAAPSPTSVDRAAAPAANATSGQLATTPTAELAPSSAPLTGPGLASASLPPDGPAPDPAAVRRALPNFRHIFVVVMENREYGSIVGNANAPYINSLIARYGLATNYRAVAHPSQPNYFALFGGSTRGIRDNGIHLLSGTSLADQLGAHRRSWRVFAENVPLGCYRSATASGGPDGPGTYARKHEPAISFRNISRRASRCAKILDFTHFSPSAADFELIVPNMCNSMHDCSTAHGDAWLSSFLPKILDSPAMQGSVLFLTFDEGTSKLGGGGRIATVVIGPSVKRGYRSGIRHTHYSLLRTIENAWGLGCLNLSCSANDLREFFR